MRTLLFRAKGVELNDNKRWYYGCYYRTNDTTYCFSEDYDTDPGNTHHYILFDQMVDWGLPNRKLKADINPDTLCQYTGVTDSNCNTIWEHDIVRTTNMINNHVSWYVVRWRNEVGGFVFTDPMEYMYSNLNAFHSRVRIEVMGNEIDNPELVENIETLTPEDFQRRLQECFGVRKEEIKHD